MQTLKFKKQSLIDYSIMAERKNKYGQVEQTMVGSIAQTLSNGVKVTKLRVLGRTKQDDVFEMLFTNYTEAKNFALGHNDFFVRGLQ